MPIAEPTLLTIPRRDVAFILHDTIALPLSERREVILQWAKRLGGNLVLVERVLEAEASYAKDIEAFVADEKKTRADKKKADEAEIERLKKEGRWDAKHNCEIPLPNTDDPKERRFRHNAGDDQSRDVTWDSHTAGSPSAAASTPKKKGADAPAPPVPA